MRLKLLCSDVFDAFSISPPDPDIAGDCLIHLRNAIDDHPPIFPEELDRVLSETVNIVLSSPSPRLIADSLSLIASLTATPTNHFTSFVISNGFLLKFIVDSCLAFDFSAAVILANLCSDGRENIDAVFSLIDPGQIGTLFIDRDVEIQTKLGFAAIFSSICSFPLGEEEAHGVLRFVVPALELYSHELALTDEIFLMFSKLRKNTENYIQLCWQNGFFQCSNLLRTDLSMSSIVTILEYYGEAIQDDFPIPSLDFHKLSDLVWSPNDQVAETAIWLM
jgi:hypothetical protein